jgi:5'-nucleotidase
MEIDGFSNGSPTPSCPLHDQDRGESLNATDSFEEGVPTAPGSGRLPIERPGDPASQPRARAVYCNRTLNLHAIKAIGYDLDYTLVHYHVETWERRAYAHLQRKLIGLGWPVAALEFDPKRVIRGLIVDKELGNLVKANRFGYVKRAQHGETLLPFDEQRRRYSRIVVELDDPRWSFLNTFFSISEGCMYSQLVELFDAGQLPGVATYEALYDIVRASVDEAHMEGELKGEIQATPERFVDLDPDVPPMLLEQKAAGKRLLLVTNSDWPYTRFIAEYAFSRYLPEGMDWRALFDLIIVSANKPAFFTERRPFFEVVDDSGLLRPLVGPLAQGRIVYGGNAVDVEQHLGLSGDELLFVGDHIWGDVLVSKQTLRWRTALVLRELEEEIEAVAGFEPQLREIEALMRRKEVLEEQVYRLRLAATLADSGRAHRRREMQALRGRIADLDAQLGPLAHASTELTNERWGLPFRTGNDKSYLARQVERHSDIYLARVSNLRVPTPFAIFRSKRGTMPHDPV